MGLVLPDGQCQGRVTESAGGCCEMRTVSRAHVARGIASHLSFAAASAFASIKILQASRCPKQAAQRKGVVSLWSLASTSALEESSRRSTSKWP